MPSVTIDGRTITVPAGTTVIQAAEQLGIYIPRYCYHPGLSIAGNCRICLVEVEKAPPKPQIACNTPVTEGMVVRTNSPMATEGRRAVLEFLLANHPLDCPVCDQSGECDLQNFYMSFGLYDPLFREGKNKKAKAKPIGRHVMLDQERCILCSRCVRFTDEVSKTGELGIFNRGDRARVDHYPDAPLDNKYSANVVDICPVGALTEREFRFKARVWYLSSAPSVCNGCARGCNIDLHFTLDRPHLNDGGRVLRLKPRYNAEVNRWWICDAGRYGFPPIDRRRLAKVLRQGVDSTWDAAFDAAAAFLARLRDAGEGASLGVVLSAKLGVEELFLARELFGKAVGARLSAPVPAPGEGDDFLISADKNPNTAGAELLGLDAGPSAESLLADAAAGRLKGLWILGEDAAALRGGDKLRELSGKLELLVYQGPNANGASAAAQWLLPAAAYVEKDGTFVNCSGRVQRIGRAFPPLAESRPDWAILQELGRRLGRSWSFPGPREVFAELARTEPAFAGLSYETIGLQGAPAAASREPASR